MSFWKNLFGGSEKETQIIKEPDHELAKKPPEEIMAIKDEEESPDIKEDDINKDSS